MPAACEQERILSVTELTDRMRRTLEGTFPFVWVRGEIGELSFPGSGHIYFTLKDAGAQLQCVWFRDRQMRGRNFDPLTGEIFAEPRPDPVRLLRQGSELFCAGQISVYGPRGRYQLIVELVQAGGQGLLAQAFEERKQALAARGFFAAERKRPLPAGPSRVALVTSPAGAAIHDFMELASVRGLGAEVRLFPVRVQGEGAAGQICRALDEINRQGWAQVAVIIRGGGSLEDLWCFNEEEVATAIFSSKIPVLAGIGHEVDVTLADMTADVRAATPSHAAQLLWPLRREYWQRLDELSLALERARQGWLQRQEDRLQRCERGLRLCSPARRLEGAGQQWQQWRQRLLQAGERLVRDRERSLQHSQERLRALTGPGRLAHLQQRLALLEQKLGNAVHLMVRGREQAVRDCTRDLARLGQERVSHRGHGLECLELRLAACNPLAPLGRGYAVVRTDEGRVLSSTGQSSAGQDVRILLQDGELEARITAVHPHDGQGGEHA
ncbi:exodeoxyribonuclease VII large subunit [Desulfovibrio piger]|uniref:exodeoxyribonuclease VII large subunit n=1 Tax=Desulfovibrio piger TaxID=901 RepID=UPI0026F2C1A7|nr:exodeoxyribonuclease VII large subunit [Desulfovibrio piger]